MPALVALLLAHTTAKTNQPEDAHDQDASTSSSQAPSQTYSRKLTKNSKERTGYRANKNQREFYQSSIIRSQNLSRLNLAKPEPIPRDHCLGLTQTPGNKEIGGKNGCFTKKRNLN
jgi:hypothetical protein